MSASPNSPATVAGLARRIGALGYDALLVVALWMTTLFVAIAFNNGEAVSAWWVPIILYAECAGYYLYSWLKSGQTLGMRTWRLKLVDEQGFSPTMQNLGIRLLVAPFSAAALGLGYLAYYWGDRQQTWHDQVSKSYVVLLPKEK
ncbi:MAG: putative RDD family membrane protein YckC [Limisphaerales bacterium]|jgi:uncharacterized RDD family membrane protein YckC